jgi:hypothetical protein
LSRAKLWQCSVELGWSAFLDQSAVQEFRNSEWIDSQPFGCWLPVRAPVRLLTHLLHIGSDRSRLPLQTKHVCNAFIITLLCFIQLQFNGISVASPAHSTRFHVTRLLLNFWTFLSYTAVVVRRRRVFCTPKRQWFCCTSTIDAIITLLYATNVAANLGALLYKHSFYDRLFASFIKIPISVDRCDALSLHSILLLQTYQLLLIGSVRAFNATQQHRVKRPLHLR